MAMIHEIIMNYVDQADLLVLRMPSQEAIVKSTAAILPFDPDVDGVPATSLVLHVGVDERTDEITGEIVGLEIPFFSTFFHKVLPAIERRVQAAMPDRKIEGGKVWIDVSEVDPSALDEDLKNDEAARNLLVELVGWLRDFYTNVESYKATREVPVGVEDVSERRMSLRVTRPFIFKTEASDLVV